MSEAVISENSLHLQNCGNILIDAVLQCLWRFIPESQYCFYFSFYLSYF